MSVDSGKGVACLFGNYAGDNMNVKMAIRKAKKQGVTVKYVVATDDVASSPKETKENVMVLQAECSCGRSEERKLL